MMIVSQPSAMVIDHGGSLEGATQVAHYALDGASCSYQEDENGLCAMHAQICWIEGNLTISF